PSFDCVPPGVERAKAVVYLRIGIVLPRVGLEVQARTKSSRPIGRSADSALDLDVVHGGGKVRHIHKENSVRLRIVDGDPIDCTVDSGLVSTPNSHPGVANPSSSI